MYQKLFCFLCLLPYVSPIVRFPAQVQPYAAVVGTLAFIGYMIAQKKILFTRSDWILLILSAFFVFYIDPRSPQSWVEYISKSMVFTVSFGIMLYAQYLKPVNLAKVLPIAIGLYAVFAIMQYIAHPIYEQIATRLVPIQDLYIGERGAASLAPEATDLGFTVTYLALFVGVLMQLPEPAIERRKGWILIGVCVFIWLLSRSTSGLIAFLGLGGVLLAGMIRVRPLSSVAIGAAIVVLLIVLANMDSVSNVRGVRVVMATLTQPASLLSTSFSHRLIHNVVGVIGFFESYGLGFGGGSFTRMGPRIYLDHHLASTFVLNSYYQGAVWDSLATVSLSVFAQLFLEYGIFGAALAGILFWDASRRPVVLKGMLLVMLFLTWFQSFPAAYPPFWLALGIARNPAFYVRMRAKAAKLARRRPRVIRPNPQPRRYEAGETQEGGAK